MTDLPTGWPLAPAFGCQLDEDHPEQRLGQEFASFVETDALPVSTLRYLHRPSKLRSIWTRILALLREPVQEFSLPDGAVGYQILGAAIFVRCESGQFETRLWEVKTFGCATKLSISPGVILALNLPWRWAWLQRLMDLAMVEVHHELDLQGVAVVPDDLTAYFDWMFALMRGRIGRNADMSQVRRRIARALSLNELALRRANCGLVTCHGVSAATVGLYNAALAIAADLDLLERDAAHLLPIYLALSSHPEFPEHGEPVQRLKRFLKGQGFSEKAWRMIFSCNRRLLLPMRDFYLCEKLHLEVLDFLWVICALEQKAQPPEQLVRVVFGVWGNPRCRYASYASFFNRRTFYPHVVSCAIRRLADASPDALETELMAILRWAIDTNAVLGKGQKRGGWRWLIAQAQAHQEKLQAQHAKASVTWTVPFATLEVGGLRLRALASSFELWVEGLEMRHCADLYADKCRKDSIRLVSVTFNGRRIATAMYRWRNGELRLLHMAGKANRTIPASLFHRLGRIQVDHATVSA